MNISISMIKRFDICDDIDKKQAVNDLKNFIQLHASEIIQNPILANIVRDSLTKYIFESKTDFIKEYSMICSDNKFDNYVIKKENDFSHAPQLPPICSEDLIAIDALVENNCKWNLLKRINSEAGSAIEIEKKKPAQYIVGQIVGAKDKENNWWMSRILYIFTDPHFPYTWYYIRFEGWDDIHNEWISTPGRIKNFNPKRDLLKR